MVDVLGSILPRYSTPYHDYRSICSRSASATGNLPDKAVGSELAAFIQLNSATMFENSFS